MAILELDKKYSLDKRFGRLGELTGRGEHDARSRVIDVWRTCIDETNDIRLAEDIDNLAGWFEPNNSFAELMVQARLAEPCGGGYRIRGVRDRMQWLVDLRMKQPAGKVPGGKARAATARRDEKGHFLPSGVPASPASAGSSESSTPSESSHPLSSSLYPLPSSLVTLQKADAGLLETQTGKDLTASAMIKCRNTWLESIAEMGSPRTSLTMTEENTIARAIQIHGSDTVDLALFGARKEETVKDFVPSKNIDVTRILLPDHRGKPRIQKFVELGARGRAKKETVRLREESKVVVIEDAKQDPVRFRDLMSKLGISGMKNLPRGNGA